MISSRALLATFILFLVSLTALGREKDALASSLIQQAKQLSDIRSEGAPPFLLRMSIRIIKGDGTVNIGTHRELWISKAQWRRETSVGNFRRIVIAMGRKRWLLDSSTAIEHIDVIPDEIPALSDISEFPGKWKLSNDREINGVSVRCLEQKSDFGASKLCFNEANGTNAPEFRPWRLSTRIGKRVCSYSDYEKYADRMFATSYECEEDKRPVLQARTIELSAPTAQDSSLFSPPSGAKESLNCLDSVKRPRVLSAPNLPPPTRSYHGTVVVLVSTVVGTDGRTHDLRIMSEPRPKFDETAIEEVQQWRFAPGTCGGEPMESEIIAQVAFTVY